MLAYNSGLKSSHFFLSILVIKTHLYEMSIQVQTKADNEATSDAASALWLCSIHI